MYDLERQKEIISNWQNLLKEADGFNSSSGKDIRYFWSELRGQGASILGLCNHLSDQLNLAADVINKLQKEEKKEGEKNEL